MNSSSNEDHLKRESQDSVSEDLIPVKISLDSNKIYYIRIHPDLIKTWNEISWEITVKDPVAFRRCLLRKLGISFIPFGVMKIEVRPYIQPTLKSIKIISRENSVVLLPTDL